MHDTERDEKATDKVEDEGYIASQGHVKSWSMLPMWKSLLDEKDGYTL